jgi:hypothetical protein
MFGFLPPLTKSKVISSAKDVNGTFLAKAKPG